MTTATTQKRVVAIPADYFFRMASREYANWPTALAREFIQNSVDAGATQITITTEDGWLILTDNGTGMSPETITDALLTLGGSQKAAGATGGFGKAKELLYFSWPEWSIHTRDTFVEGEGSEYLLRQAARHHAGTVSRCYLGIERAARFANGVSSYVRRCLRTPGRTITLNGEDLTPTMVDPDKLTSKGAIDGLGAIDAAEDSNLASGIYVLVNGLYMFYSSAVDRGTYLVQLEGRSYDLLTANRDGFNEDTRDKFDQVVKRLAVDVMSAKFKESWTALIARPRTAQGTMPTQHAARVSAATATLSVLVKHGYLIAALPQESISDYLEGTLEHQHIAAQLDNKADTPYYAKILADYDYLFREGWMFLSHEPFKRAQLAKFARRATKHHALVWQAIVNHVADANNIARDYGLGFVESPTTEAAHFNGYILFNPHAYHALPNHVMVLKMMTAAAEELTHLLGYTYHDESFKARYTQLLENALASLINHRDLIRYANAHIALLN